MSYFLSLGQVLGLVMNLDGGFNEVYHASLNNKHSLDRCRAAPFELPLLEIANNDLSPEEVKPVLSILEDKARLKSLLRDEIQETLTRQSRRLAAIPYN